MENKVFVAVLLLVASALFFAGCVQTQPQPGATPTPPSTSPQPPACTTAVYVSCPDGFEYLAQECVNGVLKPVSYLVDPCLNHQSKPTPSGQPTNPPFPTGMPTASPLPSATPTATPTVTPGPSGCTQNVTKTCQNSAKTYLDSICENGVLTKLNYFADPCSVIPSPVACTANSYVTCQGGKTYLSASCIDGVLYQVSYFMDPCA
jgi:hypothetical protein